MKILFSLSLSFVLAIVLACCCAAKGPGTTSSCASAPACPSGSFGTCEPGVGSALCVADGNNCAPQCHTNAGFLTHACPPSCASGLCAIGDAGATCVP